MSNLNVSLPEVFQQALTSTCRYVCYYGGRAGGKSYSYAIIFLIKAMQSKIKVLCVRETQRSIKESVYETILIAMDMIGARDLFDITNNCITCKITGSTFIFSGLFRNIESIKSIPGINYVWAAEADKLSKESLTLLIPTVREQNSQLFFEFNPGYPDDPVYEMFVLNPRPDALVVKVGWESNPFISQTILQEKDNDYARDPETARHVWGGELRQYGTNVWPQFDPKIHIKEFDLKTIKDHKVFMAMDPHTAYYSCGIWVARWPYKDGFFTWIFKEWPTFNDINGYYSDLRKKLHYTGSIKDLAQAFYAAEAGHTVTARWADPRYCKGFGSATSNLINNTDSLVEKFNRDAGMLFQLPQEADIDMARDTIKTAMGYNKLQPISPLNEPSFYVSANCKNVIRALTHHRYEDDNERESEIYKDMSDCMRIVVGGLSTYRWPAKPKSRSENRGASEFSWMGS